MIVIIWFLIIFLLLLLKIFGLVEDDMIRLGIVVYLGQNFRHDQNSPNLIQELCMIEKNLIE